MQRDSKVPLVCAHLSSLYTTPPWGWRWASAHEARPLREGRRAAAGREATDLVDLLNSLTSDIVAGWERFARLEVLEKELLLLKRRVEQLEQGAALQVPVESLAPEPYEVLKPFHVIVHRQDEDYIATLFDANLSASGDTREEAVTNLKDLMVCVYEALAGHREDELGPAPAKQRQVLRKIMRPRA